MPSSGPTKLPHAARPSASPRHGWRIRPIFSDPHLAARGFLVAVDQPGVGPLIFDRQSYLATDMPLPEPGPAPGLGEHTRAISRHELGLSDGEIEALFAAGVLE